MFLIIVVKIVFRKQLIINRISFHLVNIVIVKIVKMKNKTLFRPKPKNDFDNRDNDNHDNGSVECSKVQDPSPFKGGSDYSPLWEQYLIDNTHSLTANLPRISHHSWEASGRCVGDVWENRRRIVDESEPLTLADECFCSKVFNRKSPHCLNSN